MRVSVILFEHFELLDVFGPVELFSLVDGWDVDFYAQSVGLVESSQGVKVFAEKSFADFESTDILLVPGGRGTRKLVEDACFLQSLVQMAQRSKTVASVCTGAALLAQAGLLEGHRATTNKRSFAWATSYGGSVNWLACARWVEDGDRWTSSGIAAGIDMAAAMIGKWEGQEVLDQVLTRAEMEARADSLDDPFAVSLG